MVDSVKVKITGKGDITESLRNQLKNIEDKGLRGLVNAALYIRRDMDTTSPTIPVDLGNLRASSYVISSTGAIHAGYGTALFKGPRAGILNKDHKRTIGARRTALKRYKTARVELGFTAFYAVWVHENNFNGRQAKSWTRPGSGPHFLAAAVQRNASLIADMVKKEVEIL